jgi:hypothetical protein
MRLKFACAAVAICAGLFESEARSETLTELVAREEGVAFGVCALVPRPAVTGKDVHVVVPARFAQPGVWVTRTILFVGVDDGKTVAGVVEARTLDDVPPREVISVRCNKSALTIRITGKTLSYIWTGKALRRK